MHDFIALPDFNPMSVDCPERDAVIECAGAIAVREVMMLEQMVQLGHQAPDHASKLLADRSFVSFTAPHLSTALSVYIAMWGRRTEGTLEGYFYSNLQTFLPGAERVEDIEFEARHRPDGFVRLNGEVLPVEVKKHFFNGKALQQLQRYMKIYCAGGGVAVAPELRCTLPSNVLWVQAKVPAIRSDLPERLKALHTQIVGDLEVIKRLHATYRERDRQLHARFAPSSEALS